MISLVLGDLILKSLTPSGNAPYKDLKIYWLMKEGRKFCLLFYIEINVGWVLTLPSKNC